MNHQAGQFSAYILSITESSVKWWSETDLNTRALPPWVAADAAGAIWGATVDAYTQYTKNKKISDWKSVGTSALTGAVIESTGVVGKIGRWIAKLF